jgi:hypothetical protein
MIASTRLLLVVLAAAALLAGCGGEEPEDNAVEATEQNTVELAGARYRVVLFRQLSLGAPPDDALWQGEPPGAEKGLYMAVLRACATDEEAAKTSGEVRLEDAFGQRFEPRSAGTADELEYSATALEPGECTPSAGSAGDRTFDGGALVFEVPFDSTAERPMVLEIGDPSGSGTARIQLDL